MKKVLLIVAVVLGATQLFATGLAEMPVEPPGISMRFLSRYTTGIFDEGAAEIVDYHPESETLFVVNANDGSIDLISIADPARPTLISRVPVTSGSANSLAIFGDLVAIALESEDSQEPGSVAFADLNGEILAAVEVGALPDMVTWSPNGRYVLVANEGEPSDDYSVDPVGSVSIIDVSAGIGSVTQASVTTLTLENAPRIGAIRTNGPDAGFAQDTEPEYIAVDAASRYAYATLQENNAVAKIDIRERRVVFVKSLGLKDHSVEGNGLDASDRDSRINIRTWPVFGLYMPDAIAAYSVGGEAYLITANEGDGRDYDGFSDEGDGGELDLDPEVFPNAAELQRNENLGRLLVSTTDGDVDGDGRHEMIVSTGGRSISIWNSALDLVADTGDEFERVIAERYPEHFNIGGDNLEFDNRSDNKGPEPEGVVVGIVGGRHYAFVGLERQSAIMVYDVEDPTAPRFIEIVTSLNLDAAVDDDGEFVNPAEAGDIGPEGMKFIPASQSPIGVALLVVANEVSGTVSIWEVR